MGDGLDMGNGSMCVLAVLWFLPRVFVVTCCLVSMLHHAFCGV